MHKACFRRTGCQCTGAHATAGTHQKCPAHPLLPCLASRLPQRCQQKGCPTPGSAAPPAGPRQRAAHRSWHRPSPGLAGGRLRHPVQPRSAPCRHRQGPAAAPGGAHPPVPAALEARQPLEREARSARWGGAPGCRAGAPAGSLVQVQVKGDREQQEYLIPNLKSNAVVQCKCCVNV